MGDTVRVRFAPSPTGYLHVGGARTAIFNWLFARHHNGSLVLRIEDTDVERSTRESESALIDDLRWLGLDWDEGPDREARFGPYRQSERLDKYRAVADTLVEDGVAYSCFCSDDVLETKRQKAYEAGVAPRYDGTCRALSAGTIAERRKAGEREVIRYRVPNEVIRIDDLVRGIVELATDTIGDFVIVRSNGHPTYNFAAAVDDDAMEITHVLRGEEHLPNTLRQILVYRSIGAEPPRFAHLPLILAEDKSKLSKRHGASSVGELKKLGFLPDAVVNYLVLLGWSHPDAEEILSKDELVKSFSIDRVSKSAAVYDRKKLTWMNGRYIRSASVDNLFETTDAFFPEYIRNSYSVDDRKQILGVLHDSIETLADLDGASQPFRSPPEMDGEARDILKTPESVNVLSSLISQLKSGPNSFTSDEFKAIMKAVAKETSVKGKALFFPVRAALTGSVHGPDLAGVAAIKGRATVIELIESAQTMNA